MIGGTVMQWRQRQFNRVGAFHAEEVERVQAGIVGRGPELAGTSTDAVAWGRPSHRADHVGVGWWGTDWRRPRGRTRRGASSRTSRVSPPA